MDGLAGTPEGCLPLPAAYAEPPIPARVRRILVFGGSFDPPHVGHRELSQQARDAAGLDWLLVIPAARSPHKEGAPLLSEEERLGLVRLAFASDAQASVSAIEIERHSARPDQPSYTVDTLHSLRGYLPLGVELRLLMGADQALSLHRWREPMAVLALAEPLVVRRAGSAEDRAELAARIAGNWPAGAGGVTDADWEGRIVDVPLVDASSTEVRRLLSEPAGAARDSRLRDLLDPAVCERVIRIIQGL